MIHTMRCAWLNLAALLMFNSTTGRGSAVSTNGSRRSSPAAPVTARGKGDASSQTADVRTSSAESSNPVGSAVAAEVGSNTTVSGAPSTDGTRGTRGKRSKKTDAIQPAHDILTA